MKHARKAFVLLAAILAFCCVSASAWAAVYLPKSLKEIGDGAFEGITMQKNFVIRSGIEKIGSRAFANTGVEMFWLPATLNEIAPDAFDKGTAFVCSPDTYAERWCQDNGFDYDYIKPRLSATYNNVRYGETTVLVANAMYDAEPASYIWETRERERYWTVVEGETDRVLRYTNTEDQGYIYFRVSAIWGDTYSVPSDPVSVYRYGNTLTFNAEKCRALNGDSIYLEWNTMGADAEYALYQWSIDEQKPDGGEWLPVDTFKGRWNRTVYGLDKNTEYRFMLGILKDGELDTLSDPIDITTGNEETSFQMHEFSVIGTSLHMSWEPIQNAVYDIFLGYSRDNMRLFSSNLRSTSYDAYNFSKTSTTYMQVRARIPNTNYIYWGPVLEVRPTEEGPFVEFDSCEINGDIVNLSWTSLPGCTYDVYLRKEGETAICIAENLSKNYIDLGDIKPGEKWYCYVTAKCGRWSNTSPEKEIENTTLLNEVEYRALIIGEVNFKGTMYSPRNNGNVDRMAELLENRKTPDGTYYSYIRRHDLSRSQIVPAIQEAFAGADENDVSLFYIATHGDVSMVGRYAGSLATVEPSGTYGTFLMEELAETLKGIKGTKIVWISACGSGAGVYDPEHPEEENYADLYNGEYNEDEWDGWPEYEFDDSVFLVNDNAAFDISELRCPDFQVLTAARYRFVGYGSNADNGSYFTIYLTEGALGPDGSMPADFNGDGQLTQHELFTYIKLREEDPEQGMDQDVQAYPMDSDYVLFKK